jgi:hypothetical protein
MNTICAREVEPSTRITRVTRIVDLLGDDVVLIPVITDTKKTRRGKMAKPRHHLHE